MKTLLTLLALFFSTAASASTTDCQGVYIGRIWVEKGVGLRAVVYLNDPQHLSGSYWSTFNGWTSDEKKEALAVLMMAKASKHSVNVVTENADGCGMQAGVTNTKSIYLATNN